MGTTGPAEPPARLRDVRGTAAADHLDLLRGLAAVAVLAHHTLAVLFGLTPDAASAGGALHLASELGSEPPVVVFFVLSGFLIAGSVVRDTARGRWSWRTYFLHRLSRLWVVLIPGLLLAAAWDRVSLAVAADKPPGPHAVRYVSAEEIRGQSDPVTLLGNTAFVQTVLVPPFGSDAPLWSLAFEWWYYVAFPCFWLAATATSVGRRVAYAAAGLGALGFTWAASGQSFLAVHFLLWLCGAALCLMPVAPALAGCWGRRAAVLAVGGGLFVAALAAAVTGAVPNRLAARFAVAVGFGVVLYALLHDRRPGRGGAYAKAARALAGCSFTLYVVHMPVLILVRAVWAYEAPWPADARHLALAGVAAAGVAAYAYGVARLTEAHTDRVRRWAEARVRAGGGAAAHP